eukprot:357693-Chlamydomonas_euryale.AAC.3
MVWRALAVERVACGHGCPGKRLEQLRYLLHVWRLRGRGREGKTHDGARGCISRPPPPAPGSRQPWHTAGGVNVCVCVGKAGGVNVWACVDTAGGVNVCVCVWTRLLA